MSSKSRISSIMDRVTIAREVEDGPTAEAGYLGSKAQDPQYYRQNMQCYRDNGEITEFCYTNEHCCEKDMMLQVCIPELKEGETVLVEVHGSNDDFGTYEVLASMQARQGEGWVAFNMEQFCVGYKNAKVWFDAAGVEVTAYLAPISIRGV